MGPQEPLDAPYKKGDVIEGEYEIGDIIGRGDFGVVYKAYSIEDRDVYALKTLRSELSDDPLARELFLQEINIWVDLGAHPYIVEAHRVRIIQGRMHIALEYIAPRGEGVFSSLEWRRDFSQPDKPPIGTNAQERSKNTLEWYLKNDSPDLSQAVRWAIQFCYGMEHAYSKGVCHGDIKADNILISPQKTLKITDFGLAVAARSYLGLSRKTPENDRCTERTDICDFGIVLDKIASAIRPQPPSQSDSELNLLAKRCGGTDRSPEYETFAELRKDLEDLLLSETGETFSPPEPKEVTIERLNGRGNNLAELGRPTEALECFDRALDKLGPAAELVPSSAIIWNNKGQTLDQMKKHAAATICLDKALKLAPNCGPAIYNKGINCVMIEDFEGAADYFDRYAYLDPGASVPNKAIIRLMRPEALYHKANCYYRAACPLQAIEVFDEAIEGDPTRAVFRNDKGCALAELRRFDEAIECFDAAIDIDPQDRIARRNKSRAVLEQGNNHFYSRDYGGARSLYNKSAEIDSQFPAAWFDMAWTELTLGLNSECVTSCLRFLTVVPIDYERRYFGLAFAMLGLNK